MLKMGRLAPYLGVLVAGITLKTVFTSGAKLNPTIGNNWNVPKSNVKTNLATAVPRVDSSYSTLQYYKHQNGLNSESGVSSSFVPTSAEAYQASNKDLDHQRQYQYYTHQPDVQSYSIYPAANNAVADERQEFPNPGLGNLLPFNGLGQGIGSFGGLGQGLEGPGASGQGLGDLGVPPFGGGNLGLQGLPFAGEPGAQDLGGEDFLGGDPGDSFFSRLPSLGDFGSGLLGGATNLAQAFGLGGLGLAGGVIVLILGMPLLVFAILFPIAILIVSILGFPVLQLTLPPNDPTLGRKLKMSMMETARKAKEVLSSEECLERLSCKISRMNSTKLPYESWILTKMNNSTSVWASRISKSVKTGRIGESCTQYKCTMATKLQKVYDDYLR